MSNLDNLKALIAIKAEADPLGAQLQELGKKWNEASAPLIAVLDKTKTTAFTLEDGSIKLVYFQTVQTPAGAQQQLIIGDATPAAQVPEPTEPGEPTNVVPLAQA